MAGNLSYNQQIDVRYNGGMPRTLRNEAMATLAAYHRVAPPPTFQLGFADDSKSCRACGNVDKKR